ncbi:MAG: GGDEF domain-containing protein [Bilifractor sp.]
MEVPGWLILNTYVTAIAVMLLVMTLHKRTHARTDQSFAFMLVVILVLLVADSLGRLDFQSHAGFLLRKTGTFITYAGDPVGYVATLLYIDSWTAGQKQRKEKWFYCVIIAYVILNAVLVSISTFFGLRLYYYYEGFIYKRGPLFVPRGIVNMLICIFVSLYIIWRRNKIHTQYRTLVVLFPLIVFLAGGLQVFLKGVAYEYAGAIFACLLLYVNVQAHNVDYDYLTGLLNRRGIDQEFQYQIEHYSDQRPFSAFMIDLDYFKRINDENGHQAGDEALLQMAGFLIDVFGKDSYIGRYGGDEFLILSFVKDREEAEQKLSALEKRCQEGGRRKRTPYKLSFSAGYAVFDSSTFKNLDQFFQYIDAQMYQMKESHHARRA